MLEKNRKAYPLWILLTWTHFWQGFNLVILSNFSPRRTLKIVAWEIPSKFKSYKKLETKKGFRCALSSYHRLIKKSIQRFLPCKNHTCRMSSLCEWSSLNMCDVTGYMVYRLKWTCALYMSYWWYVQYLFWPSFIYSDQLKPDTRECRIFIQSGSTFALSNQLQVCKHHV